MAESRGDGSSRQLLIAIILMALALLVGLWWQGSQLAALGEKVSLTSKSIADAPWTAGIAAIQQETSAASASNAVAIADIRTAVDGTGKTLADLKTVLDSTTATLSSLQQNVAALGDNGAADAAKALAAATSDIAALKQRLDQSDSNGTTIRTQIDGIASDLAALSSRAATLDSSLASQTDASDKMTALLASLPSRGDFDTLQTSLQTGLAGKAAAADVSALSARLSSLQGGVDGLAASMAAMQTPDMSGLTARVASLQEQVAKAADSGAVNSLTARFSTLEAAVDPKLRTDLDAISGEVKALSDKVAALETPTAAVPDNSAIDGLAQRVAALDARVAALPAEQAAALESKLADLTSRLGALESSAAGAASKADLTALTARLSDVATKSDLTALSERLGQAATKADLAALDSRIGTTGGGDSSPPAVIAQVYFGHSGIAPDAAAGQTLADLAAKLKASPQKVTIVGFTDSRGRAELNRTLSLRRAMAVRRALIELGVDPALLTDVTGMGEDAPPVQTADDTAEAGNRVVQIYGRR